MRYPRKRAGGFVVPLVVAALVLMGISVFMLLYAARGELGLIAKSIEQERARMIAESAIELSRAMIFQNDFAERWYRQEEFSGGRVGYKGSLEGELGGGTFMVVAEDVANDGSAMDVGTRVQSLTYNRIDLFAEGRFGETKVIVVKSLFWHPEQKVYAYSTEQGLRSDGTTGPILSDIHVR